MNLYFSGLGCTENYQWYSLTQIDIKSQISILYGSNSVPAYLWCGDRSTKIPVQDEKYILKISALFITIF
jgi:hypothetical protein